jgi:Undecaprenyl-phosphate glucose phosphotransferase
MLKQHNTFFSTAFKIFDMMLVALGWVLAYPLRFVWLTEYIPVRKGVPRSDAYELLVFVIVFLWFLVFQLSRVYKSRRTETVWPELIDIFKAHTLAFVVLSALTNYLTPTLYSRALLVVFYFTAFFLLVIERLFFRGVVHSLRRRGFNQRAMIIVGDNEVSAAFLERLGYHPELGLSVRGVVVLNESEKHERTKTGLPILGTIPDLAKILLQHDVDQVLIAIKGTQQEHMEGLLTVLFENNVDVRLVPDIHQFITVGCEVEEFEGLPLIALNQSPIVGWNSVVKRITDIFIASVALVVFGPFMLIIATLIKVFTPGPIFIRQERMGLDGRVFRMLKFRSMRVDAESGTGAVWAKEKDDRVTWIGRIIRKTSLDELPQLFNVIRGEMSCVGPRPERPSLVEKFKHDIPKYMLRHKVKAGMTGWAQINGWRGNTSLEKRIEYDLYYIAHWSIGFDLKILFWTVFKGFISKNAY